MCIHRMCRVVRTNSININITRKFVSVIVSGPPQGVVYRLFNLTFSYRTQEMYNQIEALCPIDFACL